MNVSQVESYNQISIDELLDREIRNPTENGWVIIFAKARIEQCTQSSLKMVLTLLQRDHNNKWLQVLRRFSYLQFKLVFSFCIKRMRTYKVLMQSVTKLGQSDHQRMLQQNIQRAIDGEMIDKSINGDQLWTIYLQYLSEWITNLPHRTIYALEKIQCRLGSSENIYQPLVDKQKIPFITLLCQIVKYHEQVYVRRLQLRKFWQSIPHSVMFLQQTLYHKNMIYRVANSLDNFDNKPLIMQENIMSNDRSKLLNNKQVEKDKQMMVMLLMRSCQVTILQDIFIKSTRLATVLLRVQIIDYSKYRSVQQLQRLQSSLIYQIASDDLCSLISQLLVKMSIQIPNFLSLFVSQCLFYLNKDNLEEIVGSDIMLKLCILSKVIIQRRQCTGWDFSIKELVDRLVVLSETRSEMMQMKTLLMMHYFKEILPESYFIQYHNAIFRILKCYLQQQIQRNKSILLNINNNNMNDNNIMIQSNRANNKFVYTAVKYSQLSYKQCIKMLQQQTQKKNQQQQTIQMRIRRKKFTNHKYINDLFRNYVLEIADKLIELVSIQGYCQQQSRVLQILRGLLIKYPIVLERNTVYLLRVLSRQMMEEYHRVLQMSLRQRVYNKILLLLQCIQLVWGEVTQQTYMQCQQCMIGIIQLLKQHHLIQFQQQLIRLVSVMITKANMITPQLNIFIIYCGRRSKQSVLGMQCIVNEMCRGKVIKSVREQWLGLIIYMTNVFNEYLQYTIKSQTIEMYNKVWIQSVHLIQLFMQCYSQQFQSQEQQQLLDSLYRMQNTLLSTRPNEQINQLLMTIHHITHTTTKHKHKQSNQQSYRSLDNSYQNNNSFNNNNFFNNNSYLTQIAQLNLYQQKYSLHLLQLTILDTLNINLRTHIFDFSQKNNPIYPFIDSYNSLILNIQDITYNKINSPNDTLPFNQIHINQYTTIVLDSLKKDKLIDIQQFTELKSIFLPHNYLISHTLFQ